MCPVPLAYDLGGHSTARRFAFIVDLVNVFSLLRAKNGRSAVALDTGIIRSVNISCIMDGVNGIDGA